MSATTIQGNDTALIASDRCDRCGAQAYLLVELVSGGSLLFCAHHAREHGDAVKPLAARVVDEMWRLDPVPVTD